MKTSITNHHSLFLPSTTYPMFTPSPTLLQRYADVLVNFALHSGWGVKPGEVVQIVGSAVTKPLLLAIYKTILKAGAHPLIKISHDEFEKSLYELADDDQLVYSPTAEMMGTIECIDHRIGIIGEEDKYSLSNIDPAKIMTKKKAMNYQREAFFAKENNWKLTRTLALYGTESMAWAVDMSIQEYREQIAHACFLHDDDPIQRRRQVFDEVELTRQRLSDMPIQTLHIQWPDADLTIALGEHRKRLGGSGRNIPSFEIFTSPDRRGTNGRIRFDQPLYRDGNKIEGIEIHFKDGLISRATATINQSYLDSLIAVTDGNKVGEYSLTDRRHSQITKVMGETLYDENMGWPQGNTHIAIGSAYKDAYTGDMTSLSKSDRENLGFNDSAVHTDIISTAPRTVTATMTDGSTKVIYTDGMFTR